MDDNHIERLRSTPIKELNLGDVRLRRKISRAGFESILDLVALPESRIDDMFGFDDADAIVRLKERYERDPDDFARSVLEGAEVDRGRVDAALREVRRNASATRAARAVSTGARKHVSLAGEQPYLPDLPFANFLAELEKRVAAELDNLADQHDDVMVYQAFDEFATELDEIDESFRSLFRHYSSQPRLAVSLIDRLLRNAFLVYIADRARKEYDGGNLWGNLFGRAGVDDGNVQGELKRVFVRQLETRGMPLYAADEETNHYFYTALLHGGLSADSWASLWAKSLLPLVKEMEKSSYGFGGEMDGRAVLREIKNPESRFAPKKSVLNILEKAPDHTIAPLFEASIRVASQAQAADRSGSGVTMVTSYGLPDIAMQALRESSEEPSGGRAGTRAKGRQGRRRGSSRIVYLPEARLMLDLAEGLVSLRWSKQQFPSRFVGMRVDYYVDGSLELSNGFDASVGKCILPEAVVRVKPQSRYDIEIKLMEQTEAGEWEERSSLEQTFARSKPEVFEFIRDASGLYRLRGKGERINRRRRIAYLIKEGFGIRAGQGMAPVSEHDAAEAWEGIQVLVYDVEPGASGSVVDLRTREEVAVWQERYAAKVDKRRIIGETAGGLDLYGYYPCDLGTNGGLPSVSIESAEGLAALDDLDVFCLCDGERVSVPRHVLWQDAYGDTGSARVALVPSESTLFDWHIGLCELEARQRSAGGKVVFRYRFSVVPIQEFRLKSASVDYGTMVADYGFQARQSIRVTNVQGDVRDIAAWGRFSARTLLEDEFLSLRIESSGSGKATDARLALAGIGVELPEKLVETSKKHPVCLADALELGPSCGNVKVAVHGWRYNRAAMSLMGGTPMFFKELRRPGGHAFNLFARIADFVQTDGQPPADMPLRLSVCYGDDLSQGTPVPAWTDIDLLPCREGLGFSSWRLLAKPDGTHAIALDGQLLHDVRIDFRRKIGGALVGSVDISEGSDEAVLPQAVVRLLDTRRKILMTVAPTDWMGEPDYTYSTTFMLSR